MHVQRKQALDFDDMVAIATVGAHECLRSGITTIGDCSFSGRGRARRGRDRPPRDRLPRGLRPRRLRARPLPRASRMSSSRCCRTASTSASRPTPRTPARSRSTTPAPRSGSRRRPISPRARPSATGSSTAQATGARSPSSSCRRPGRPGSACSPARACSTRSLMAAHCVHADAEEIALLAANGVGVAHCPRSNGYLGCGVAPVRELLDAGVDGVDRDRQPRVDAVPRPLRGDPHGDRRRAGPRAATRCPVGGARARARDARRRPRARARRPHRLARAGKAGRPDRDLACRISVRSR